MRSIVYLCNCGGKIIMSVGDHKLTCQSCDAIFEQAPSLVCVQHGRDECVQEGNEARRTTERVGNDPRAERTDAPTVR